MKSMKRMRRRRHFLLPPLGLLANSFVKVGLQCDGAREEGKEEEMHTQMRNEGRRCARQEMRAKKGHIYTGVIFKVCEGTRNKHTGEVSESINVLQGLPLHQ